MSRMPIGADQWLERGKSNAGERGANVPARLRLASIILRTVFIVALLIVTVHVSMPQSASVWTAYDTPGDLIRLALGFSVCFWVAIQLFAMPNDAKAHRTWLYLGLAAVPFIVICMVGIW